jgi:F0F1-type ATP synthase membrane subunit b/b'
MQNDDLKDNVKQILDDLKSEGDKLLKEFEEKIEDHKKQFIDELSKSSNSQSE